MKHNKVYMVVLFLLLTICLTGCDKKETSYYNDIKKLDTYLYEINYEDYRFDKNLETVTKLEEFGCSSVKNGNYYGRNFDFIYNDVPEFVVKVASTNTRHASVGVAIMSGIHSNDNLLDEHISKLELIPNFTLDGINDAGVVVSDNVVSKEDGGAITGTNPGKEKLHQGHIVRYVLDNANSADNAIELLKDKDIYGDLGDHYNLHIMIADKNKTYVVEFIDNKMIVEEKTDNEQIMTNYYVNVEEYTENAAGIERYNILKENYNEGNSFEGMRNLLKRVQFSKAYLFNNETEWYSEFVPQSILANANFDSPDFAEIKSTLKELKEGYWVTRGYNDRASNNSAYWQTTHNSTYDINNKKLSVVVQENYDKHYDFELK